MWWKPCATDGQSCAAPRGAHHDDAALIGQKRHGDRQYLGAGKESFDLRELGSCLVRLALVGNDEAFGRADREYPLEQLAFERPERSECHDVERALGPLHLFLDNIDIREAQFDAHRLEEPDAAGHAIEQGHIEGRPDQRQRYARQSRAGTEVNEADPPVRRLHLARKSVQVVQRCKTVKDVLDDQFIAGSTDQSPDRIPFLYRFQIPEQALVYGAVMLDAQSGQAIGKQCRVHARDSSAKAADREGWGQRSGTRAILRLMTIDILCRVVDNFGDIGVVYRLARSLSKLDGAPALRLIVDNLEAFGAVCPEVDAQRPVQVVRGWTVLPWSGDAAVLASCRAIYERDPARIVIEAFACGRPEWLESMLFDPADSATKTIINLEYLTAEPYADEFHLMPSLTRSPLVKKYIFMPGFTEKTGGLILDEPFMHALASGRGGAGRHQHRLDVVRRLGLAIDSDSLRSFWIVVFGYERDYERIIADIAEFAGERAVIVIAAAGKSQPCLTAAWELAGRPFPLEVLPFVPQESWDALVLAADFSIVRGEDSLSRAALAGRPFLWHAYPQDGAYQLVKVRALLDRMAPFFEARHFAPLCDAFIAFNDRTADGPCVVGTESILPVLRAASSLQSGFERWSDDLVSLGSMAAHLMTCINEIV